MVGRSTPESRSSKASLDRVLRLQLDRFGVVVGHESRSNGVDEVRRGRAAIPVASVTSAADVFVALLDESTGLNKVGKTDLLSHCAFKSALMV